MRVWRYRRFLKKSTPTIEHDFVSSKGKFSLLDKGKEISQNRHIEKKSTSDFPVPSFMVYYNYDSKGHSTDLHSCQDYPKRQVLRGKVRQSSVNIEGADQKSR